MTSVLEGTMKKRGLRAVIFGAERNGTPILRTALGRSTDGVPATTDMHFRIGGVGWQYLATMLMIAVDRKELALDGRVSQWFPSYPDADKATLRMLATSTTGFGDYIRPQAFSDDVGANPLRLWTAGDLVARSLPPHQTPAFGPPGTSWQYSHTDFVMIGAIVERASKRPYGELLDERILRPLGLHNTRFQQGTSPQLPALHTFAGDPPQDSTSWNPSFVSWAAMTSDVCDLGTWNKAFAGGRLLSEASKSEITAPRTVGFGQNTPDHYFGMGTLVVGPWLSQRASYWGMYTTTAYDRTTGISISVTVAEDAAAPSPDSPATEIVAEISKILVPEHPLPN
jgi:CubicO group peptidase (beta-lactamase class C family)